jgi:glycosyltransferase involved in cell wall biosynthesis
VHVFFITQWFPTDPQPLYGIFVLEHARAVAQIHTVTLLYIHGIDPTLKQPIQITPITTYPGMMVYQLSYLHPEIPFTTWIRRINGARQAFKLASEKYGRPDIIHANIGNTADVAVLLGGLAGIPVVVSEHSSAYARKRFTPAQIRKTRFFMNRVDVIMPVCDALGKNIRSYGITRPMESVQNVADTEIFYPAAPGEQVSSPFREISLISRLNEEKAVHLAIQAAARLQRQGTYFQLQIAGDGPERAHLESMVDESGLSEWVHFHGYQPKTELAMMLRRSSAFLLTSLWESQPVVILEALSCGLPVSAPAIGGIPEVITPECGLLFQPGDLDDLSAKLTLLLSRISEYNPQVIRAYAVEHFSPHVVANRFDAIYRKIIESRHAFDTTSSL